MIKNSLIKLNSSCLRFTKYTIIISELLTVHKRIPLSRETSDTKRFLQLQKHLWNKCFFWLQKFFEHLRVIFQYIHFFSTRNGSFFVIRNSHVKFFIFNNYIKLSALILILKLIKLTSILFCWISMHKFVTQLEMCA